MEMMGYTLLWCVQMAAAKLLLYVSNFTNLWAEGRDASIQANVEDGKASVNMHFEFGELKAFE